MPKLIYKPRRDIPNAVRYLHTFSPTEIREWVLDRFNKSITPQSITMWLKRNPEIKEQLEKEIVKKELPLEEVRESVFKTGTFELFDSVDIWIRDMKRRKLRQRTIDANISALKRTCKGYFKLKGIDLREKGWSCARARAQTTLDREYSFIPMPYNAFKWGQVWRKRTRRRSSPRSARDGV